MRLVSYNNAHSFLKAAEDFLLQNESLNNLMLGIAGRLLEGNPDEGEPIFYVIYSDGHRVLHGFYARVFSQSSPSTRGR